ncbi:MAG: helix-turn-helix transcriptional regulator [Bacteroidota bacterium]
MEEIKQIIFENKNLPDSHIDCIKLEDLLRRKLEHDPTTLHTVNFYILILITAGEGQHTIDFTDYTYRRGTVLLIRKDQVQKFFHSDEARGVLIIFTEDFILSFIQRNAALEAFHLFNDVFSPPKIELDETSLGDVIHLTQYLEEEYQSIRDDYSPGILRSLLHVLLAKLDRYRADENTNIAHNRYLQEFLAFQALVEQKCFQTRKVMDYADDLGVSTKKLNMIVQSTVHKSAKTFIDEILILRIKRLLINSDLSGKEIAYTTGFDEPTNLYKFFKRYTGSTPEAFRQAYL